MTRYFLIAAFLSTPGFAQESVVTRLRHLQDAKSITITESPRHPQVPARWTVIDDPKWIAELISECEFDGEPFDEAKSLPTPFYTVKVPWLEGNSLFFTFGPNGQLNCDRTSFHKKHTIKLKTLAAYERLAELLDQQGPAMRLGMIRANWYRGPRAPGGTTIADFFISKDADQFLFVSRDQHYLWHLGPIPVVQPGVRWRWDEVWWVRNEDAQLLGKDDLRTRFRAPKGIVVTPDEKWIILLHEGGLSTIDPSQPAEGEGAKRPTWLPALPHPDSRFHLNKAVFGKVLYGIGDTFLATFSLDESSGELRLVQDERLHSPIAATLDPDGRHLYVLGENSLSTFECLEDGRFKKLDEKEAEAPKDLAISRDGRHLYVANGESIAIWNRDPQTGLVRQQKTESCPIEVDLVRVSPKGKTVIGASTKTGVIALFFRYKTGDLGFQSEFAVLGPGNTPNGLVGVQYDADDRLFAVTPTSVVAVIRIRGEFTSLDVKKRGGK